MSHTPHVTRRTIIVPEGESGVTTKTIIQNVSEIATVLRPYNVYTALLTQTGTNAPVATVLENTLGGTVVWARSDVGRYTATLSSAFTADKTFIFFSLQFTDLSASAAFRGSLLRTSADVCTLTTFDTGGDDFIEMGDSAGIVQLEIRVYP